MEAPLPIFGPDYNNIETQMKALTLVRLAKMKKETLNERALPK